MLTPAARDGADPVHHARNCQEGVKEGQAREAVISKVRPQLMRAGTHDERDPYLHGQHCLSSDATGSVHGAQLPVLQSAARARDVEPGIAARPL